jgi:hypothetical protein
MHLSGINLLGFVHCNDMTQHLIDQIVDYSFVMVQQGCRTACRKMRSLVSQRELYLLTTMLLKVSEQSTLLHLYRGLLRCEQMQWRHKIPLNCEIVLWHHKAVEVILSTY